MTLRFSPRWRVAKIKVICGGSALEHGARRIVDSVLPRPDARTVGPATQGLRRARKQICVPGLRIAIVNNYRNHHGRSVHQPCISNSRRNLERNHGLLCAAHEASVSFMHLRAELLLHHNRKSPSPSSESGNVTTLTNTTSHAFHSRSITISNQILCLASHSLPPTTPIWLTSPTPLGHAEHETLLYCSLSGAILNIVTRPAEAVI